ncbi:hypothetical protein F9278_41280 [Streptomyces phaeolivaceus]|uniref:Uncharacterized protein n=1 Tax=Streptomyces phaeolivaceus TaxID=2653200 RepID=A0A5P8KEH8_9ACTN|nr:hypothetical protein [Streptomyces phaeolivaceus]QFR01552.1 hypothetical protein F9278_41280 [Streptomyces phaeolivaceus]
MHVHGLVAPAYGLTEPPGDHCLVRGVPCSALTALALAQAGRQVRGSAWGADHHAHGFTSVSRE